MLFLDFNSQRYFVKDEEVLMKQLCELEEKALKGEIITYNEYYETIGLLKMNSGDRPIGLSIRDYFFRFDVYRKSDYTLIFIIY